MSVPGEDLKSVMLDAKAAGKRTANISDVDLTDATPAAMGASVNDRNCQGPTDMGSCPAARKANGGKGSIAEQLVDNKIDVLLGGGRNRFTQNIDAGGDAARPRRPGRWATARSRTSRAWPGSRRWTPAPCSACSRPAT